MSLPVTVDETFKRTYAATLTHLFQQTASELRPTVRNEPQEGEMKMWDFIGETSGQEDLPRGAEVPDIPSPYSRRKNTLHKWNKGEMIYEFDKLRMLLDPTSDINKATIAAANRWVDEKILQAVAAIVYTGKEGGTAVNSYDIGECRLIDGDGTEVAAGSNFSDTIQTGLTLAKIALIGNLMDDASVPQGNRHLVANTDQKWYLLGSTKATSADYASVRALTYGEINSYLGFTFHWLPSARFTENATDTGCYECCAYQRDAVLLGVGKDIQTSVDRMPKYGPNAHFAQAEVFAGAVRLQGPGVVRILLKKAPGVDFTQS